jgi:LysM repeat protein
MKRAWSIGLSLVLVLAAFAPAFAAADRQACLSQYTVKPGDNLFRIGLAFGVPWTAIATANNLSNPSLIFPGQVLCIPAGPGTAVPSATPAATAAATNTPSATASPTATLVPTVAPVPVFTIPTFSVVSVVKDTSVTIQTANFPAGQDFDVTMGPFGGLGIGGTPVATTNSGAGGVFTATYSLPAGLAGMPQIAIRMQSASGFFAFNWFWNVTAP